MELLAWNHRTTLIGLRVAIVYHSFTQMSVGYGTISVNGCELFITVMNF